ncbi:protein MpBHLH39 [Marchantia polymorpha subsp. ruderalis]|nr:hypothetical protein MARPO_0073s0059 [Marchantia polymorpha]BBN12290.1 hypothetical protein Mp_5g18820 [Marchantia polymorpha subsp. ruderalis]|eukprot:PTQ35185.1 hypothetical protein MARPO_0073s0059 [Marchantia polymorpha]
MDHVLCDSSGITLQTSIHDGSDYSASFLKSFLPAYNIVNLSADLSTVSDRFKAIQFAADASLAISGSGASWSDALSQKLAATSSSSIQAVQPACEERQSRGSEPCASPAESTSSNHHTGECGCPPERTESASSRLMRSYGNLFVQRKRLAGRRNLAGRTLRKGDRENCFRNHECYLEASRQAILKKLALRNKSKRRLLRCAWKPKPVLRKVKSLARPRSRPSRSLKVAESVEQDQDLESRFVALQRLVPGGSNMDTSSLLDETADFVMFLQMQVQSMQALASALDAQQARMPEFSAS